MPDSEADSEEGRRAGTEPCKISAGARGVTLSAQAISAPASSDSSVSLVLGRTALASSEAICIEDGTYNLTTLERPCPADGADALALQCALPTPEVPTAVPTAPPSSAPTFVPTSRPSPSPSLLPTSAPTGSCSSVVIGSKAASCDRAGCNVSTKFNLSFTGRAEYCISTAANVRFQVSGDLLGSVVTVGVDGFPSRSCGNWNAGCGGAFKACPRNNYEIPLNGSEESITARVKGNDAVVSCPGSTSALFAVMSVELTVCCYAPTPEPSSPPPSPLPSTTPSAQPSARPSAAPTTSPSAAPSSRPTAVPSAAPTAASTALPSGVPTAAPSTPTSVPTAAPSATPSVSSAPSATPSAAPSPGPSARPTAAPSSVPTAVPTAVPSGTPTAAPSSQCALQDYSLTLRNGTCTIVAVSSSKKKKRCTAPYEGGVVLGFCVIPAVAVLLAILVFFCCVVGCIVALCLRESKAALVPPVDAPSSARGGGKADDDEETKEKGGDATGGGGGDDGGGDGDAASIADEPLTPGTHDGRQKNGGSSVADVEDGALPAPADEVSSVVTLVEPISPRADAIVRAPSRIDAAVSRPAAPVVYTPVQEFGYVSTPRRAQAYSPHYAPYTAPRRREQPTTSAVLEFDRRRNVWIDPSAPPTNANRCAAPPESGASFVSFAATPRPPVGPPRYSPYDTPFTKMLAPPTPPTYRSPAQGYATPFALGMDSQRQTPRPPPPPPGQPAFWLSTF